MPDLLHLLWPAVEAVHPVFSRAAIVRWPREAHAQLVRAKLIVPDGTSRRIRCPECGEEHTAASMARTQPDGTSRVFIVCPEYGRADITHLDRQQWAVNIDELASMIARELRLSGTPKDLAGGGRIWRCGRTNIAGKSRDVLFARGLCRLDASQYRRTITGAHHPIVFVGSQLPPEEFWHGVPPTLIRLCDVAMFDGVDLKLETAHVLEVIAQPDASSVVPGVGVTMKQVKAVIRQQVKADKRTELTDEIFTQAYLQHGSVRAAAAFLSERTGQDISKDKVQGALARAGGARAVLKTASSNSVLRPVSSHRRDKHGKTLIAAQDTDD